MQYYQCKCGDRYSVGSMPPAQCAWCENCQSSIARSSSSHRDRIPHKFEPSPVETDEGTMYLTRCIYCHRTKKEIEEKEKKV